MIPPETSRSDPDWPSALSLFLNEPAGSADNRSVAIVGVPFEASISPSKADLGPQAIREALARYSTFDAFATRNLEVGSYIDLGDLSVAGMPIEAAWKSARSQVASLRTERPTQGLWLFLGGDNAITRPCMGGLIQDLARSALLTFDAHHDVRTFHAGPTNGTPVRGLIEDGLPAAHVSQIGIGRFTNSPTYRKWAHDNQVRAVTVDEVRARGIEDVVVSELARLSLLADVIYVDIDIDVLDSAFAPGCPGARPGGLTPPELFSGVYEAARYPSVVGMDFVELDPTRDVNGSTALSCAQALLAALSGFADRSS